MLVGVGTTVVTSINTPPSPPFVITGSVQEFQGTSLLAEETKQMSYS
jgi:hypothetical protein